MPHDLVIQGPEASPEHARALQALTRASAISAIRPVRPTSVAVTATLSATDYPAFRLTDVRQLDGVEAYCQQWAFDHALVESARGLADFRLVAMDMDSTLITIECIDEIADFAGKRADVSAVTARAMRGEIAFAESLRLRVSALAGLPVTALERVYAERLRLSPGAETLLGELRTLGIKTLLVSGGFTFFTDRLKSRLGLDYTRSNTLEIVDGRLTGRIASDILDAQGKASALRETRDAMGATAAQVIAIGDGANDLPMMAEAAISIAFRAKPVVREHATYSFDHVGLDGVLNLFR